MQQMTCCAPVHHAADDMVSTGMWWKVDGAAGRPVGWSPSGEHLVQVRGCPGLKAWQILLATSYDKVRQSVVSKSKSKKHGPIAGSNLGRNGLIRACDWSMLSAFAFAL